MNSTADAPADVRTVDSMCPACGNDRIARRDQRRSDCPRCGCAFSTAFDDDAGVIAREQQTQLDTGFAGAVAIERHRAPIYAAILDRYPPPANGSCLDVGCGMGLFSRLAALRGWRAVGVDPVTPVDAPPGVRFVRAGFPEAQGQALAEQDASFHLVTFINTLNFMRDPLVSLREAHRLLVPGGTVIVRVPNESFHRGLARAAHAVRRVSPLGARWIVQSTVSHPRSFTARAIEIVLRRAGFRDVRVEASRSSTGDPYAIGVPASTLVKAFLTRASSAIWKLSRRRLVCSPSLLAIGVRSSASAADGSSSG